MFLEEHPIRDAGLGSAQDPDGLRHAFIKQIKKVVAAALAERRRKQLRVREEDCSGVITVLVRAPGLARTDEPVPALQPQNPGPAAQSLYSAARAFTAAMADTLPRAASTPCSVRWTHRWISVTGQGLRWRE